MPVDVTSLNKLKNYLHELEWDSTRCYVERLREQGELLSIGPVDVDVPQILERHFMCDAKRCIEWAGERPLIDRSCCCRYDVPVSRRDREVVEGKLDHLRKHLPKNHRLKEVDLEVFEPDDNYTFKLNSNNPLGACIFNDYQEGQSRCLLHGEALKSKEHPLDWKPYACGLWPMAVMDYSVNGENRYLLTIYCKETAELFDAVDDDPFACIEDDDPSYPLLYQSERSTLEYLFGNEFYLALDEYVKSA